MLTKNKETQNEMILNSLEELVPEDHLVRKLDDLDYSFIYDYVKDLYSDEKGRPSIDPVILFKILMIKHFFNIKSIRQTIKEIEVNIAYRWFLGIPYSQKVPHFTVISVNYNKRFKQNQLVDKIFQRIINEAYEKRIINDQNFNLKSFNLKMYHIKHKLKKKVVITEESLYDKPLV